jgi:hypothetical protein
MTTELPQDLLRKRLERLAELIGDSNGEVRTDDGESWYSLAIGVDAAIEVDIQFPEEGDLPLVYNIWIRTWDRTHGLASENKEGAFGSALSAVHRIQELLAEIAKVHARLDAQMMDEPS